MRRYPKISIVIPSFNKVEFVKDTLESILLQRYPNLEVIVQDGKSTDGTWEIVKDYAKKHPEVFKIESKKDKGQLDAINKGLKKATGELLSFINADDVYEQGAFEKVALAYLRNPKALWFVGRGRVIDKKGKEIAKLATFYKNFLLRLNNFNCLLMVNYIMQPSVFLTKKAYKNYGPFTGTKTAVMEYDLWLKLFKIQKPVIIPYYLSCFRLYKGSISVNKLKEISRDEEKILRRHSCCFITLLIHKFHNLLKLLWV